MITDADRFIVVERVMPHSPEKIWRALTQSALIAEWLMENEVVSVEAPHRLVDRWGDGTESDSGLKTVVTWTLAVESGGTRVRVEQSGFRPQDEAGFKGMDSGWPRILERLERIAAEVNR
jgi:uncharacterized protein YndB with AHSA1/START domain